MWGMTLPPGFTSRAPRPGELGAVNALVREHEEADEGEAESTIDDLRGYWERARFDLKKDARVVVAPGRRLAGYVDVWDRTPGEQFVADGYVRPDMGGHGVGTFLVRTAEARAREKASRVSGATISHTIFHENEAATRLLIAEGYTPVQHFWRMVVEFGSPPGEPAAPQGITMRPFVRGQDDRAVWQLVTEAFSDNADYRPRPFEEWAGFMTNRESFDPSLFFIADASSEIAGVALCPKYEDSGWVRQLAVRGTWRRRGVGRALMQTVFAEYYRRGYKKVGLVMDSFNRSGAREFYLSLGMHVERQHDRYEKPLL